MHIMASTSYVCYMNLQSTELTGQHNSSEITRKGHPLHPCVHMHTFLGTGSTVLIISQRAQGPRKSSEPISSF